MAKPKLDKKLIQFARSNPAHRVAKLFNDHILGVDFGIPGGDKTVEETISISERENGYNFHEVYLDEATQINEEKLKFLMRTTRNKIEFENGSFISFHSADDKNSGRGLRPFVPHPCQEEEFALSKLFQEIGKEDAKKVNFKNYDEIFMTAFKNKRSE